MLGQSLGGRLFPGVHHRASFTIDDQEDRLSIQVRTENGEADVDVEGFLTDDWPSSSIFPSFTAAAEFFQRGDCGFSCSIRADRLEGLQLKTLRWQMRPLRTIHHRAAFFENGRFPGELVCFDCALLMRGIPHEWHEISDVPELIGAV